MAQLECCRVKYNSKDTVVYIRTSSMKPHSISLLALYFIFVKSRVYIWPCRTDSVLKGLILIVDQKSKFGNLHITGITSLISWGWFVAFKALHLYKL